MKKKLKYSKINYNYHNLKKKLKINFYKLEIKI